MNVKKTLDWILRSAGCLFFILIVPILFFVRFITIPTPVPPTSEWGCFSGDPKTEWLPDGRRMEVLEAFTYTDSAGRIWTAPKGWVVDGASIPEAFWSIIGGPLEGKYRNASICHDVECDQKTHAWREVHRMFYEGCRCAGLPENKAKVMYAAVYLFGPRWEEKVVKEQRQVIGPNGKRVFQTVETRVKVPTQVTQQPGEDVRDKLEKYVNENNPSLDDIEKMDPKVVGAVVPD